MAEIKLVGKRKVLDGRMQTTPRRRRGERTSADPAVGQKGRPTDYKPEYAHELRQYFATANAWEINTTEKGAQQVIPKHKMPTLGRFAANIGVGIACLYRWAKRHEEFAEAMADAMELQKTFIFEAGGITMAAGFATFLLKSAHQMRDDEPTDDGDEDDGDVEVAPIGKGQGEE